MNIFESPFSKNTCGLLSIPDGKSGGIQLMMVDKDNKSCNVKLLHDQSTDVDAGGKFTTVSEKISCSLSVNTFVLYLNQPSSYSWVLENSITINIYNFRTNKLLATKVIGKQDSLVRLSTSKYKDKPCIVLSKCDPDVDFDLNDNFVKIEIISMCDGNASPCCDSLPTQIAVSGYNTLCIPLQDFYSVPSYPATTTTASPYSAPAPTISLLDDLAVKESSGVPYYVVDAHISTSDGSDFAYWWERSEDNTSWYRITDLKTEATETLLALKEVKTRDYYYRLYFDSPEKKRSNVAFFNYPDPVTTTTTTTTAAPLVHPNPPTSVAASGGAFRQVFLSWKPPAVEDIRAPVSGYRVLANTADSTSAYDTSLFSSEVSASTTGYFQPVAQAYDGIMLHYCISAANFFGFSEVSCASAATISTEPPIVSNLVVTPDDTDGIDGFLLNWDTGGVNEVYPLVSHKIRHRTSGTADTYSVINYPVADLPVTQVKVIGSFDNCEQIEFLVDAESTIGTSIIPASGYGLYAFLSHAPTNLSLELEAGAGEGEFNLELGWSQPTDSGRCEPSGYVYNYRLAGTLDWSIDVVIPATGATMSIDTQNLASGMYEARVAAITIDKRDNIVGTGAYGGISASTLVKLDFEDWIQNNSSQQDYQQTYYVPNKSLYGKYASIHTYDNNGVPTTVSANPLDNRDVAKFGSYGFYGSDENQDFNCPKQSYVYQTSTVDEIYPYKIVSILFDGLTSSDPGSPQVGSNNSKISLTNSSTELNDDGDGETRSTMECWFKLPEIDTTLTDTDIGIMGVASELDPSQFNMSNYPQLQTNFKTEAHAIGGGYPEDMHKAVDILGDYIFGSGLRLRVRQFITAGGSLGWSNESAGDSLSLSSSTINITATHPNYISDTEWHHLALVSSGNNLKLYVDGTGVINHDYTSNVQLTYGDDGSSFSATATGIDIPSYFSALIAGSDTNNGLHWWGNDDSASAKAFCIHLDEVRLSKVVAYSGNFDVPTEPLI